MVGAEPVPAGRIRRTAGDRRSAAERVPSQRADAVRARWRTASGSRGSALIREREVPAGGLGGARPAAGGHPSPRHRGRRPAPRRSGGRRRRAPRTPTRRGGDSGSAESGRPAATRLQHQVEHEREVLHHREPLAEPGAPQRLGAPADRREVQPVAAQQADGQVLASQYASAPTRAGRTPSACSGRPACGPAAPCSSMTCTPGWMIATSGCSRCARRTMST